jgi:hypothetical protein
MIAGLRTCPICHDRVLPTSAEECPACRKYTFTGAPMEFEAPRVRGDSTPEQRAEWAHEDRARAWRRGVGLVLIVGGMVGILVAGLGGSVSIGSMLVMMLIGFFHFVRGRE